MNSSEMFKCKVMRVLIVQIRYGLSRAVLVNYKILINFLLKQQRNTIYTRPQRKQKLKHSETVVNSKY